MPQAIIALPNTQQDRKNVPDVWLLIADLVSQQDIRTVSHTSRWLNKIMARHPLGYIVARIRGATPRGSASSLYAALKHADTTNRFIDIVAGPDAFPHDDQLGGEMLDMMSKSGSKIIGLELTLSLGMAPQLCSAVQAAKVLRALHVSFECDVLNNAPVAAPPLDLSQLFGPKPGALKYLSIISEVHPVVLPTANVGELRGLQYVQLCGSGVAGGWPAGWKNAISTLATYVPTMNVRLHDVDIANVDVAPLLHGLSTGPLLVAFPDTCLAPGHFMVSTEDGSIVRRLQWGWGDADEDLTSHIYSTLAPVAAQIVVAHIDSTALVVDEPAETRPPLLSLRKIVVHAFMGLFDTDGLDLDAETPAERAARLDAGGLTHKELMEEIANDFFDYGGREVPLDFWCEHCGNPDAIPEDVQDRATATPGPSGF